MADIKQIKIDDEIYDIKDQQSRDEIDTIKNTAIPNLQSNIDSAKSDLEITIDSTKEYLQHDITSKLTNSLDGNKIRVLSSTDYANITTKDTNTLYFLT